MKTNSIDLKQIQDKIKEYQSAEEIGQQKIIVLNQEVAKKKQQVLILQGAISAMTDLLPQKKEKKEKNIIPFNKKGGKDGKQKI